MEIKNCGSVSIFSWIKKTFDIIIKKIIKGWISNVHQRTENRSKNKFKITTNCDTQFSSKLYKVVNIKWSLYLIHFVCYEYKYINRCLTFSPKGRMKDNKDFSSLSIFMVDSYSDKVSVSVTASILDKAGKRRNTKTEIVNFSKKFKRNCLWSKFMKREELFAKSDEFLLKGTLTIYWKVK